MNNIFGTDGIRAKFNTSPFTKKELFILTNAISDWIISKYKDKSKVIISHDTRESCNFIKNIIINTLIQQNIPVLDLNVSPTPVLFHLINKNNNEGKFTTGIIISASHNPYYDNGIKLVDSQTGKLNKKEEKYINNKYQEIKNTLTLNKNISNTSDIIFNHSDNHTYNNKYINIISKNFKHNYLKKIKVVLDTANGATYQIAPKLFKKLGAQVITINNTPNGKNINLKCGATNTKNLQEEVIKNKADIGFAFDGDGDRVMVVNKHGEVKNGDDILALLLDLPEYKNTKNIVGTVMTNQGLEDFLNKKNISLIRVQVGDKNIIEKLNKNNLCLGGEQSGHIILRNIINTGDGLLVALKVLESVILNNNWDITTFNKYPQIIKNIKIKKKMNLTNEPFCSIIKNNNIKIKNGRILIRYSGTEPLLRIMVEEKDPEIALRVSTILSNELEKKLS